MYLITDEEALDYVDRWQTGRLSKDEWTHEMHLICGLWAVLSFQERSLEAMRARILRHNEAVGTINSDSSGYHETLSVWWLAQIRRFAVENAVEAFGEAAIDLLIFDEQLAQRNGWLAHWSEAAMKSVEARRSFLKPDLKPFDEADFFIKG